MPSSLLVFLLNAFIFQGAPPNISKLPFLFWGCRVFSLVGPHSFLKKGKKATKCSFEMEGQHDVLNIQRERERERER